ncbi:rod shape-determining protein [Archaeoglobus veneficus]|uniref:Actin/actin family protein n=1 Tax=Archaeoglobus veneficus (strain DSM 11195 / SNP6) TaxID=693661 RepID=F2KT38_ARCVS|nr:rod shape-determining protein [Archaeoglobus veneficus]AEA47068.1 actin/actin family protein [Archaeoglobus veneficus SNP6]
MIPVGLDIGTNYTKATKDGKNVTIFPSIVAYGEEKDWSLKGEEKEVYVGEEALAIIQSLENVEAMRPLHEGRLMHQSYMELAKHALKVLDVKPDVVATGLPVKSSKKEREELAKDIKEQLKTDVLIFPEPVGTLAYMGIDTGVCVDIGFGTTDIVVLGHMEYLRGDTMLVGVDWLYDNIEVIIRNKAGISVTPEELTKLLTTPDYEVGRIRGGKRITISHNDVKDEYEKLMKSWVERISSRTKLILEGLSTAIVDKLVLTGGGSLLPGAYEEFSKSFEDVAEVIRPDDPITSNAKGYYTLAKILLEEKGEEAKAEEAAEESKAEGKKKGKVKKE